MSQADLLRKYVRHAVSLYEGCRLSFESLPVICGQIEALSLRDPLHEPPSLVAHRQDLLNPAVVDGGLAVPEVHVDLAELAVGQLNTHISQLTQ